MASKPTKAPKKNVVKRVVAKVTHKKAKPKTVVLAPHLEDTAIKDRARENGDAHLVDTPNETERGALRAAELKL